LENSHTNSCPESSTIWISARKKNKSSETLTYGNLKRRKENIMPTTNKPSIQSEPTNHVDPALKSALSKLESTLKARWGEDIKTFEKEVLSKAPAPKQLIMGFIPHQMAKTSIFFPMSDKELKEENRKINKIEHKTHWGKIVIEGIKLSIAEEDVFLALMIIAKENYVTFEDKFVLETTLNKIIHMLYGREGYSKANKEFVLNALRHFQLVRFELDTSEKIRSIGNIVSSFEYKEGSSSLKIHFNSEFFAYFLQSLLTHINYTLRRKLKKDGSKALVRFLSTHNKPDRMHILTVLNALNYNTNQPMFRLRSRLKAIITELKKHGVLGGKTKLFKDDTVYFETLQHTKTLPNQSKETLPV